MKKKDTKEFALFQKEFLKYQTLFGLNDYKVCFSHKALVNDAAQITPNEEGKVAEVVLATDYCKSEYKPSELAKHEAIHLLLTNYEYLAKCRFVSMDELNLANESLVRRLEKLIP